MKKIVLFVVLSLLLFNSCNPGDPALSSPVDRATNQSTSPILNWNASSGATSYTLQVSVSNTFTSSVYNQSGLTSTSQQVGGLSNTTTYYWRVSASNTQGTSGWSGIWSFTTIGTLPNTPVLSSPVNGAINQSTPPTLIWNASSGATSYKLQVSENSSFTSSVYNQSGLTGTSQQVSGLSKSKTYYWRVSASNSTGASNPSTSWLFTTSSSGGSACPGIPTVTYSGKTYNTVQVGTQCWLKENLNVGIYVASNNTGSTHSDVSNNGIIEKYCYENDESNCTPYGGLYDWNEAMGYVTTEGTQGICPPGWHIPTFAEFEILKAAVNYDGNALKSRGQGTGSGAGTNTSGFSALFSGCRNYVGSFNALGDCPFFWSSTEDSSISAFTLNMNNTGNNIRVNEDRKEHGFSVRCVKDN